MTNPSSKQRFVWLVERFGDDGAVWCTANFQWTTNASEAVWFVRERDAELFCWNLGDNTTVTEHCFISDDSPDETAATPQLQEAHKALWAMAEDGWMFHGVEGMDETQKLVWSYTLRYPKDSPVETVAECICLCPFDKKPGPHHSLKCPRRTSDRANGE